MRSSKAARTDGDAGKKASKLMTVADVLEQWAKYSDYDPERKKFNLLNGEYDLHKCNTYIRQLSEYDPSGALAAVYAKNTCRQYMQESKISLFDAVSDPERFEESREMWKTFSSPEMSLIEDSFLDGINDVVSKVVGNRMIGQRDKDAEREAFFSSVTSVVEDLGACRVDLFRRGAGPI